MNVGGYHVYIEGCCSVHRRNTISTLEGRDIMSTLGGGRDIMSTLGDVQHIRGIS